MTNQLTKLSILIANVDQTARAQSGNHSGSEKERDNIFSDIRHRLSDRVSNLGTSEGLGIFIRQTQIQLVDLANEVYQISPAEGKLESKTNDFHKEVHCKITDLLLYLRVYYDQHFDHSLPVPDGMEAHRIDKKDIAEIGEKFRELDVDPVLLELLEAVLKENVSTKESGLTWAHLTFHQNLLDQLRNALKTHLPEEDSTVMLMEVLMAGKVNSSDFYRYILRYIDRITEGNATYEEKEDELEMLWRKVCRTRETNAPAYYPEYPSIRKTVRECLEIELESIRRIKVSNLQANDETQHAPKAYFQFVTMASIEELLLLVWLLIETGFIKKVQNSRIYTFIGRHVRTNKTERPSTKYMQNHFGPNNASDNAKRNLRVWLTQMVNKLDEVRAERGRF